jgi:hypothetical protein
VSPKQVKTWFAEKRKGFHDDLTRRFLSLLQVRMSIFGSSHGNHGLPEELEKLRAQFPWCLPFDGNTFDSEGGRKIRDIEVEQIRQHFLFSIGPSIFIIILGTNNIRRGGNALEIVGPFREILENAVCFSNIQIVIVSLIPSAVPEVNKRFLDASNLLKNLVKEMDPETSKRKYENATFFNLNPTLSPSNQVAPVYFKSVKVDPTTQRQKNVHLSPLGANRLAYTIFDHCTRFIINKFK